MMTDKQEHEIFNQGKTAAKTNNMKIKLGIVVLMENPYGIKSNNYNQAKSNIWQWGYESYKAD